MADINPIIPPPERIYDGDGFRRIRPSERSPGMTELRLANGRCFQAAGFGPEVDQALQEHVCHG